MADADFDGFGGGFFTGGQGMTRPGGPAILQRYITIAGALSSVGLVIALGMWGYQLAVRDVSGVPVVQALEGPMRIAPVEPGGDEVDYQGLAVNEVAAVGTASPPPERLILAPRPVELTLEDAAGLAGQSVPDGAPALASAITASTDMELAVDPLKESADPVEVAVAAALAEAMAGGDPAVSIDGDSALVEASAPDGAITRSPRPVARPAAAVAAAAGSPTTAGALPAPAEIDASTLVAGTRLVQFGAFDTIDQAKSEWTILQSRFADLMDGKAMVVQAAESGGRTFYRLRAHGFEDEADARRFCAAFLLENAACIPVAQR